MYSTVDREWLSILARRAAFAIQNARLVENMKEAKEKLFHAEKLASVGQLASGIAHEIRNPLSAIKMNLQSLSKQAGTTHQSQRRYEIALSEVDRLEKLVQEILTFARPSPLVLEELDIHTILDSTIGLLEEDLRAKTIEIKKRYSLDLPSLQADRDKLIQVFLNIFLNAVDVLGSNGYIEITTDCQTIEGKQNIRITISDNGPGIDNEIVPSIFNPFFSTKAEGTGLGLTNALKFVEQHGGTIHADQRNEGGATFTLIFPLQVQQEAGE
jgi:two-component system sensor histidine kinase HydH